MKNWPVCLLLLAVCFTAFSTSLGNDFLMDDESVLFQQENIPLQDFLQVSGAAFEHDIYFRPAARFLNFATFRLFQRNPEGYHVVNIVFLWLTAVCVFWLLEFLFDNAPLALLTAVLYCLHPVNSILVNYKNATCFPVMNFVLVLGLYLSGRGFKGNNRIFRVGGVLCFAVALLCHEVAVVYPLYLFAVLFWIGRRGVWPTAREIIPQLSCLAGYLLLRVFLMNPVAIFHRAIPELQLSWPMYFSALAKLFAWYFTKFIFLDGIVMIWDAALAPESTGFWIAGLVGGLAAVLAIIVRRKNKSEALFLSWALIGLLPVTLACLSRPHFGIYIETFWLPLTTVAALALLAQLLLWIQSFLKPLTWQAGVCCVVVILFSQTLHYNYLWGEQKRYCQYWIRYSPRSFWAQYWLGVSFLKERDYHNARAAFLNLLQQGIRREAVFGNLGIVEYRLKNYEAARAYFQEAAKYQEQSGRTLKYIREIETGQRD